MNTSLGADERSNRGKKDHEKGYAFEDRVAEAYRLLGYRVEHGRLFSGRQIDIYLELTLADLRIRRAVECKAGEVKAEDIDDFLSKLRLVQKEAPEASGTIVSGVGFTNAVASHAAAIGVQLTLYRDLSAQILDGPSYAQGLIREIENNERYVPHLFVEPMIGADSSAPAEAAFTLLNKWLQDSRWNQLTLLGDVGTGKSFLCRMLAHQLAKEYLQRPTECPLPILVDLRKADREFSLEGLMLTHFASHGLTRATFDVFDFLLSEGRILLMLDGFDEMAARVTPIVTTRNFHELARCVKRNAKVLLTCRTHYFKSRTEEEEVVLGGSGPRLPDVARDLYWDLISRSGFKIAYLRPFSLQQIEEYVRKACPNTSTEVIAKINNIYNLAELSQRPLLLEMIVKSVDKFTTSEVNPAQLYEIFTSAWIHRDRWRDVMRPEDKVTFVAALARSLWEQEKTTIDHKKLEQYVGTELARLIDEPGTLVEIDAEIRTASFLIRDERGHYGFAHSSYAEYFLAKELAAQFTETSTIRLALRLLSNEVIDFLLYMVDVSLLENTLTAVLRDPYKSLLSENALVILYRLRRRLLVDEQGRGGDTDQLRVELPTHAQLQGAKLTQVTLEGAILHSAQLDGADLRQCIAPGADLTGSSLKGAKFSKADLHSACLRDVDASEAILADVNLQGADLERCSFRAADLSGAMLTAKNLSLAIFENANLESALLPPGSEAVLATSKTPIHMADEWHQGEALQQIFETALRYAKRMGDRSDTDAEDAASDVIVYILSKPAEISRIREFATYERERYVRTLAASIIQARLRDRQRYFAPVRERPVGVEDANSETLDDVDPLESFQLLHDSGVPLSDAAFEQLEASSADWMTSSLLLILKESLTERASRMLIQRYVEDLSVAEIATIEGLSEMQVVHQLKKARELARIALSTRLKRP